MVDYGRMQRKKRDLRCAYCGSRQVHSIMRPTQEEWLWKCECGKVSLFGYIFDESGGIRGVTLYQRLPNGRLAEFKDLENQNLSDPGTEQ
jgi:hypothetical protein